MGVEIERRFLLQDIPAEWLEQAKAAKILQGYLITEDQRSLRVRRKGDKYTITSKSGHGLSRQEEEQCISAELFDMLWPLTAANRIEKTRHTLQRDGLVFEIDIFSDALAPLKVLEVEFTSETLAHQFKPPLFCKRELTEDGRFTNAALSRNGLPADWDSE